MEPPKTAPVPPETPPAPIVQTPPAPLSSQTPAPSQNPKVWWYLAGFSILVLGGTGAAFLGKQFIKPAVVPTPTPIVAAPTTPTDPTANWKTHTSSELGVSIKYPSELYLDENSTSQTGFIVINSEPIKIIAGSDGPPGPITLGLNQCTNTITNSKYPCDSSLEERLASMKPTYTPDSIQVNSNFITGGRTGYQISGILTDGFFGGRYIKETAIPGPNGYLLIFTLFNKQFESQYDQILSTFKFTNASVTPTSSIQTPKTVFEYLPKSGWSTYTDSVAKFSVQYNNISTGPYNSRFSLGENIAGDHVYILTCNTPTSGPSVGKEICLSGYGITVYNNYNGESRRDWLKKTYPALAECKFTYEDALIAGKNALVAISNECSSYNETYVLLPNSPQMIIIHSIGNNYQASWFRDMLSTFKYL